jgi:hypothetical protein
LTVEVMQLTSLTLSNGDRSFIKAVAQNTGMLSLWLSPSLVRVSSLLSLTTLREQRNTGTSACWRL